MSISESEYVIPLTVTPVVDGGYEVNVGGMGEQADWSIGLNQPCHSSVDAIANGGLFGIRPCQHAVDVREDWYRTPEEAEKCGNNWREVYWTIPRTVECATAGGYDGTLVCLDCILEAAAKLPEVVK